MLKIEEINEKTWLGIAGLALILVAFFYLWKKKENSVVYVPQYIPESTAQATQAPATVSVPDYSSAELITEAMSQMMTGMTELGKRMEELQSQQLSAISSIIYETQETIRKTIQQLPEAVSEKIIVSENTKTSATSTPGYETIHLWTPEKGWQPEKVIVSNPYEQIIKQAKQAYYEAEKRGDTAAMQKAHEQAEAARQAAAKAGVSLAYWTKAE